MTGAAQAERAASPISAGQIRRTYQQIRPYLRRTPTLTIPLAALTGAGRQPSATCAAWMQRRSARCARYGVVHRSPSQDREVDHGVADHFSSVDGVFAEDVMLGWPCRTCS